MTTTTLPQSPVHTIEQCEICDSRGFRQAHWSDHIEWRVSGRQAKECEDWIQPCKSHRCDGTR